MAAVGGTAEFDTGVVLAGAGADPAAREAAHVNILNQANAIAIDQRTKISELETALQQVNTKLTQQENPGGQRDQDRRTPLSRINGFKTIPNFTGKREDFAEWSTKVLTFLSDEKGLRALMKNAAKQAEPINDAYIIGEQNRYPREETNVSWYSQQLHTALTMITTGTSYSVVLNTDGNGLEAWRKLHTLYAAVTPQGKREMLDKVMNYPKAKGYGDVLAVQEEWEAVYLKYREVVPEGLPQDVLITSYIRLLPGKISESLRNLNEDTLEEVKDYVRRQVNAHRPATSYKESKPVPMNVGVLESIRNVLNGQQTGPPDLPQCTNQANTANDHSHTGDTGYYYSNNNNDDDIIGLIASAIKGYIPKGKGKGKGKGHVMPLLLAAGASQGTVP